MQHHTKDVEVTVEFSRKLKFGRSVKLAKAMGGEAEISIRSRNLGIGFAPDRVPALIEALQEALAEYQAQQPK